MPYIRGSTFSGNNNATPPNSTANRSTHRYSVLKAAHICFDTGMPEIECTVTNISETGMRILVPSPQNLPDVFRVVLKQSAQQYHCQARWWGNDEIGVLFLN